MKYDWHDPMWDREWKQPRSGDRGRWYVPTEEIFLETVGILERAYQVPIIGSPGYVGLEVLRATHEAQGIKIKPLPFAQKENFQTRAKQMCNWISWSKWTNRKPGLSEEQKRKKYIVGYDKNGQFLGSAQSVRLGNGGYVTAHYNTDVVIGSIGFWCYELLDVSGSLFDGENLPCPLDRARGWISTDLYLACVANDIKIRISDGIIWQEGEKYLSKWAKEMWQHRVNMKKIEDAIVRRNCEGTAKHIPNSLVGRLANEYSGEYFHPDWNRSIVHRSVANLTYTLAKIKRETNLSPILVSKDALYFATDEEDVALAIPGMLDHQQEQRGWKPIGICAMTDEIIDAFATGKVEVIEQCIKKEMKNGATAPV